MTRKNAKNYEVLRATRGTGTWITLRLEKKWYVQAQVFPVPSMYGIGARDNEGNWLADENNLPQSARISRLCITTDPLEWSEPSALYNYDRGLDFNLTDGDLVDRSVAAVLDAVR